MKTSLGFVLGCISVCACASLGACKSSSSTNGGGVGGSSSGGSSSRGGEGTADSGGGNGLSSSGGSSSGGSSSGRSSSSGSPDGSSGSDGGGGGQMAYIGEIGAIMASADGNSSWNGAAGFVATPDGGGGSTCTGTQSGNCCYVPAGSGTAETPSYVSAGVIVVKDGSNTIATMSPSTQGSIVNAYDATSQQDQTYRWAGGDTLSFAAAGGTVNAFSGTVVAPGLMQGIAPPLGTMMGTMVRSTSDFTLTWEPGTVSGATSSIYIGAANGGMPDGSIHCNGMDSDGSITVPQALLARFSGGDALQIVLTRLVSTAMTTGNVSVLIAVSAETLGLAQLQ
ncbi:MAG TPA: hypothetical protein VF765_23610 [Polyangiaceae bacterium]